MKKITRRSRMSKMVAKMTRRKRTTVVTMATK